tara:strand:- start:2 stop:481 length:480 start_codon:yes stop_codon:yes gene_type:complete
MALDLFLAGLSLFGTKKSYDAQRAEAKRQAEIGVIEARQFVNDLFLTKAAAIADSNQIIKDMKNAESKNIAAFGAMGRDDRSVRALLKENRKTAGEDIANLERATELQVAKLATSAAVSFRYGQGAAAGLKAEATANLITGIANIAKNLNPDFFKRDGG